MKAVIIPEFYQSLDQVHVSKIPQPIPEDDELLIRVEAAGVNFVDTLYVRILISAHTTGSELTRNAEGSRQASE